MVWQNISPEVRVEVFKKCCMSNVVDETDDDTLYNGNKEDGNVRSECEEDEGTAVDRDSDIGW
jgi:uncharacterized FAD-dependent dehydrogenase